MKAFVTSLDNLPLLVKIILALPCPDVVRSIYRIVAALDSKNMVGLIIAVILLFIPITWVFDIFMVVLRGGVWKYTA